MGRTSAALKRAAAVQDRLRPGPAGVTILIYHRVGGRTPISVDLPTSLFDEQMAFLAERCERKVRGGMRLENDVRDLVNRWRYRGATR